MRGNWLIGEHDGAQVQMFVQCGLCRVRIPIEPGDDSRALLAAHLYCAHGARMAEPDAAACG
jgi:hypothetical protein